MSRQLLINATVTFRPVFFQACRISLFVLLGGVAVLLAQDPANSPKAAEPGVAAAQQPEAAAPDWMDTLLGGSEEVEHVDAPGTAPHPHPGAEPAAPAMPGHDMGAMGGGAATTPHGDTAMTLDPSVVRLVLGLALGLSLGLLMWARLALRTPVAAETAAQSNVLDWPVIGGMLRSRAFNYVLIVPTLIIFLFIVLVGLLGQQDTTNPATLLTWILWWPAVIFSFMILGRIWCVACPFGYVGDLTQRVFSFGLKPPRILKNMWWRLGLFLALTWLTTVWNLYGWPWGTAWLALTLTIGAVSLGVIYQKRTFCRYVCPVGGVFGLYAMTSPVRIAVKDKNICQRNCPEKDCAQACRWFEFAPTLERSTDCNLCLDCARACPHDNIVLQGQPIGAELADFQPHRKSLDEATMVAAVVGVSLFQTVVMLNAWPQWEATVSNWLHIPSGPILYTVTYLTIGLVIPALLVAAISYISSSREERRGDIFRAFRAYAYIFLPLGLALHAAHNFKHLFGEGGAMVAGVRRALASYTGWAALAPPEGAGLVSAFGPTTMFVIQSVALLGGLYLAFWIGVTVLRRVAGQPGKALATAMPVLLFAVAYTVMNIFILAAPMAHRH